MSKTIKRKFVNHLTFVKFLEAHERASIGKRGKKEVITFEMDLETNLIKIMNDIKNNTYQFGHYKEFKIYEPKERIIKSLPYRDRIVHQWYVEEFIKPYFYPRFIKDTYACLENKGTHNAALQVQKYMRRMKKKFGTYYVLKCDIKKYFYHIDKDILFSILTKHIRDQKILAFTKTILDDKDPIGIPIGNYTSQFFANIYLNEMDHYIKEELKIKYYVRYMDDFIFLLKTKKEASILKEIISDYLCSHLHLSLNRKSKFFPNYLGIDFCGYRIFETHILLRKRFKKEVKKKINMWKKLKEENRLNQTKMVLSWNSMVAHAHHASSYTFMKKMEVEYKKLFDFYD